MTEHERRLQRGWDTLVVIISLAAILGSLTKPASPLLRAIDLIVVAVAVGMACCALERLGVRRGPRR